MVEYPKITVMAKGEHPDLIDNYGTPMSRIVKNKTILDVTENPVSIERLPTIVEVEILAYECGGGESFGSHAIVVGDEFGNKPYPFKISRNVNGIHGYFCFFDRCSIAECILPANELIVSKVSLHIVDGVAGLAYKTIWRGGYNDWCPIDDFRPLAQAARSKALTLYCTKLHHSSVRNKKDC